MFLLCVIASFLGLKFLCSLEIINNFYLTVLPTTPTLMKGRKFTNLIHLGKAIKQMLQYVSYDKRKSFLIRLFFEK